MRTPILPTLLSISVLSSTAPARAQSGEGDQFLDGIGETALIARYPCNGTLEDRSRNSLHAAMDGGQPVYAEDERFGQVLRLPGGRDGAFVRIPGRALAGVESLSVTGWVKVDDQSPGQPFFDLGLDEARHFYCTAAGRAAIAAGADVPEQGPSMAGVPTGKWAHLAVVLDATRKTLSLYVDGVRVGRSTGVKASLADILHPDNPDANRLYIGKSLRDPDAGFGGSLHDVRFYSIALTDPQVAGIHHNAMSDEEMVEDTGATSGQVESDSADRARLPPAGLVGMPDLAVETPVGYLPHLPYYVPGTYRGGVEGPLVRVIWPAPTDNRAFSEPGTCVVTGSVPGTAFQPTATVRVLAAPPAAPPPEAVLAPFPLGQVMLNPDPQGRPTPFMKHRDKFVKGLAATDPDSFLYNFRDAFGQAQPDGARPLSGWDSQTTRLRGHASGHYLTAIAQACAGATGDPELHAVFSGKMDYMVDVLYDLSRMAGRPSGEGGPANADPAAVPPGPGKAGYDSDLSTEGIRTDYWNWGEGFISAYPPDQFIMLEQGASYGGGNHQIWAPYYTLHKILAGLMDCYEVGGNRKALEIAQGMGLWVYQRLSILPAETRTRMWNSYIAGEYGGMNEAMARLHRMTGDRRFLDCAQLFDNTAFFFGDAGHSHGLARNVDTLRGRHANQHIPQITGALETYQATHDPAYYRVAENFWNICTHSYMYSIGGVAGARIPNNAECFTAEPDSLFNLGFSPGGQNETCATYNLLKLGRRLFLFEPDARYMDYYERALYNHILASVDEDSPANTYHVPLNPGARKSFGNARMDGFTCCNGTALESATKLQNTIYLKRPDNRALYINLFVPSTLSWPERNVTIRQSTSFPYADTVTLQVAGGGAFDIHVRVPGWARQGVQVKINGNDQPVTAAPGGYLVLGRDWQDGDTIDLRLPMDFHLMPLMDQPNIASIFYGPVLLAAEEPEARSAWRPVTLNADNLDTSFTGDPATLRFQTGDTHLQPFYEIYARHSVYFDITAEPAPRPPTGHAARAEPGRIDIDTSQKGPPVNPAMYGIFLEEINHGVDGGLYAELVRNRAFEDSRPPEGYTLQDGKWRDPGGARAGLDRFGYDRGDVPFWSLVREGGAEGTMNLETRGGISEASAYCLRLDAAGPGNGRLGVANEGFFGIGLEPGKAFTLSLYARGNGPLSVRLENAQGEACSDTVVIAGIGDAWRQFTGRLTANRAEPRARLVLLAGTPGPVWLDVVSLFPAETWKGRVNGLRPDLAQLIADLKPGFVRFPGGCVVEGGTVETAYNWKDTVGPLQERRERFGPWMYRRTHGMGIHEYLQFCEDLQAEPLWVGFAGQTCIFRQPELVPMDDMGWVRDGFLDFVEYANGPADSTWGKRRTAAGHPEPFHLNYVEIGNENQGPGYGERYRFVYDAMKARYPDLTYLADLSFTSRESLGDAVFDIEDRHHYSSPRWFATGFHRYDDRDRNLPPLYLGEVAVTSGDSTPWRGNLLAALSEGIFLMGCERNADTVRMVSYAPLLGHVEGRTELVDAPPPWHALIYFDNTRAAGTVSYQLWKLFGNNLPDYTVRTEVVLPDAGPLRVTGSVGLGTWGTAAEFRNVRVEKDGETLYQSDFAGGATEWTPEQGRWECVDGAYRQARPRNGLTFVGEESWSDYTLTLQARKLAGSEGFLVPFGRRGNNKYWWNLGGWGNTQHAIEMNQSPVGEGVPGHIETDRWYDIRIELNGDRIRCFLDDQLVHDVAASREQTFFATAGYDASAGDIVLKAINLDETPVPMILNLDPAGPVKPHQAPMTTLCGDTLSLNNTLDDPARVVPQAAPLDIAGPQTPVEFPPHSLTVIRIRAGTPAITAIVPPEKEFYGKSLDYHGIPIKSADVVVDEALHQAYQRLSMMLDRLPAVRRSLAAAKAELHIIGRNQVTTDLPEWRRDKDKPLAEYHGLTRDQRTRGMGGRLASCGEENLLRLDTDRYHGTDICVHEFAHSVLNFGAPRSVRKQFETQRQQSLADGRWVASYAATNADEFFAELAMWYFGTHGNLGMEGPKPANGPDGLKAYDPDAYTLVDDFWSGRVP